MRTSKKWNHYTCPNGHVTVARHDDEGVTPFMIGCAHCDELTQSSFFSGDQRDDQKADVVFFRPEADEALKWIMEQPEEHQLWLISHYQQGGALMRKA